MKCGVPTTLYAARVNSVMFGSSLLSQQWEGNPLPFSSSTLLMKSLNSLSRSSLNWVNQLTNMCVNLQERRRMPFDIQLDMYVGK